jgi:hypothetical protein
MQLLQGLFFLPTHARAAIAGLVCMATWGAFAQEQPSVAPAPLAAASKPEQKPLWKDLTPAQQQALAPLATHWNVLNELQKHKWLALSLNFNKMTPAEQTNLHERMLDWGTLSAAQRSQARLNFSETKRLAPTEKQAKWEAYQTLDPEEKEKLAHSAPRKLPGAATATKLVPPQKLAVVPPAKDGLKGPSIAAQPHQIDAKTLLPLPAQYLGRNGMDAPNPAHPTPPANK